MHTERAGLRRGGAGGPGAAGPVTADSVAQSPHVLLCGPPAGLCHGVDLAEKVCFLSGAPRSLGGLGVSRCGGGVGILAPC